MLHKYLFVYTTHALLFVRFTGFTYVWHMNVVRLVDFRFWFGFGLSLVSFRYGTRLSVSFRVVSVTLPFYFCNFYSYVAGTQQHTQHK